MGKTKNVCSTKIDVRSRRRREHNIEVHFIYVEVQASAIAAADDDDDDDASVWRQKWGSQLPCEVSAERMSGFRET